jgi:hypothetical protein
MFLLGRNREELFSKGCSWLLERTLFIIQPKPKPRCTCQKKAEFPDMQKVSTTEPLVAEIFLDYGRKKAGIPMNQL